MAAQKVADYLKEGKYDLPLFLEYLRGFAISGEQPDKTILLRILLEALARFNTNDFTVCMCLVASHVQDAPGVEKELGYLYELENFLCCGDFGTFWIQWSSSKDQLPPSPNFETRVRTSILETIGCTMQRIATERLVGYLGVPASDVIRTVEECAAMKTEALCVVSCDNDMVMFAKTLYNAPESNVNQDMLHFSDIINVIQ